MRCSVGVFVAIAASAGCCSALGCSATPAPLPKTGPVPQTAHRLVLEPSALAFVSSSHDDDAPPAVAVLGAGEGPRTRILVRFDPPSTIAEPLKAYLVLERAKGALAGPDPITLLTERVTEPWSVADGLRTSWASPPASEPLLRAEVPTRGGAPIRIDVTAWASELARPQKGKIKAWGLRIEGKGDGYGLPIATGYGGGTAPWLEIYVP